MFLRNALRLVLLLTLGTALLLRNVLKTVRQSIMEIMLLNYVLANVRTIILQMKLLSCALLFVQTITFL